MSFSHEPANDDDNDLFVFPKTSSADNDDDYSEFDDDSNVFKTIYRLEPSLS
jgi:hypothetical protein